MPRKFNNTQSRILFSRIYSYCCLIFLSIMSLPALANEAPSCAEAFPSQSTLWPANHKYKNIDILGITDADGDDITLAVQCIRQDEPLNGQGDGNTDQDGEGIGSSSALVRAERKGNGNGRVYHITYSATDPLGARCLGAVQVAVPKAKKKTAIDDGPSYDSSPNNGVDCSSGVGEHLAISTQPNTTAFLADIYSYDINAESTVPSATITYQLSQAPVGGVIDAQSGELTWTASELGEHQFVIQIISDQGSVATQVFKVTVQIPPNHPPVADDLNLSGDEDTVLTVTLIANDADGDALDFSVLTQALHGTLSGTAPNLTYQPDSNYFGQDSFSYSASDAQIDSNTATVSITINAINDTPEALAQSLTLTEDTPIPLVLQASDAENDLLSFNVVIPPQNGTLSGTAPNVVYTPDVNYFGLDSFSFTASDANSTSNAATVSIEVESLNDRPVADGQSVTVDEDETLEITLTGSDPEGDTLVYSVSVQPQHGTLFGTAPDLIYTPDTNFNGSDSFQFITDDGDLQSIAATIEITINPVNDAPTAHDQSLNTVEDHSIAVALTGNDIESDTLTFSIVTQPSQGVLTGGPIDWTYTPNTNYFGSDSFTFISNDGLSDSPEGSISIDVTPENDLPESEDADYSLDENSELSFSLYGSDVDGDNLSFSITEQPTHGSLTGTAPALIYTPSSDYSGSDQLSYSVADDEGSSAVAVVSFTINSINTAPSISSTPKTGSIEGLEYRYDIIASDADGDVLSYELVSNPTGMTIDENTGAVRWRPGSASIGTHSVTIRVTDDSGVFDEQSYDLQVISSKPPVTHEGTDFWFTFMRNYTASDQTLSLYLSSQQDTSGTVEIPALNKIIPFTIAANTVETVTFEDPEAYEYLTAGAGSGPNLPDSDVEKIQLTGIHLTSINPITVTGLNHVTSTTDGFLALPKNSLGKHYTLPAYTGIGTAHGKSPQVAVLATEDNTQVSLTPAHNLPEIGGIYEQNYDVLVKRSQPIQRTINKGEVYYLYGYIVGSQVSADKPIAVFSGNTCQEIPIGFFACDHMVEQLIPTASLGNTYYSHPFAFRALGDAFFVIGTQDNTRVSINSTQMVTLNQGDVYETTLTQASTVSANHPIVVSQFNYSNNYDYHERDRKDLSMDPFMLQLAPVEQYLKHYTFTTPTNGFRWNFVNIIARTDDISNLSIDGVGVDASLFVPILGSPYQGAALPVSIGQHTLQSEQPFGVTLYGYDEFDSYGYAGGLAIGNGERIETLAFQGNTAGNGITDETRCYDVLATDSENSPVANAPINYVVSGANSRQNLAFTDVAGIASICYRAELAGSDTLSINTLNSNTLEHIIQWSLAVGGSNQPPVITRHPDLFAPYGEHYSSEVTGIDPEGDALSYTILEGPLGLSINTSTGHINWQVPEDFKRAFLTLQIADANGQKIEQRYQLSSIDYNYKPIIVSNPVTSAIAHTTYSYQLKATDKDLEQIGKSSSYSYRDSLRAYFEERPDVGGMWASLSTAGNGLFTWYVNWNVGDIANTDVPVTVVITDGFGKIDRQSFTIHITENQPPIITSNPVTQARVDRHYVYQLVVTDPEVGNGSYFRYELLQNPVGMSINRFSGKIIWTPTIDQLGDHAVVLEVTDNAGNTVQQSFNVTVLDQPNVLPVFDSTAPTGGSVGIAFSYEIEVSDADNDPITLTAPTLPTGAVFDATIKTITWTPTPAQLGDVDFVLNADDGYASTEQSFSVTVTQDLIKPQISITSPDNEVIITKPTNIVGSISDEHLSGWRVLLQREGESVSQELASGTANISNATLATIDPTLLINGAYSVVVIATDISGNETQEGLSIVVEGALKVGNFSITLEDINIPMAGVPIQVTRTYDSRQKALLGDFGYGWTIDYQNLKLQETRTPGLGWQMLEIPTGPNLLLTNYCIEPVGKPNVVVTLPDGRVERFKPQADPHCSLAVPNVDVALTYVAESGTTSTLATQTSPVYRFDGSNLVVLGDGDKANPDFYTLTTKAGYVYNIDQSFGIEKVTTPNGQTLTYSDTGIIHSAGKSIQFLRDGNGLIQRITTPANDYLYYSYNSDKDLTANSDEHSVNTRYTYNNSHGLIDIKDQRGRHLLKNIYDNDGRLIAQEDNAGNRTSFNHNLTGRQSSVTDRRGNTTLLYYDDRGNVLSEVDALGEVTSYTYDNLDNQLSKTDALGRTTTATYDTRYNQLTQTDALGNTTGFSYNARGQELTITDAKGQMYNNVYDSYGNLLSITDPQGQVSGQNINAQGLVSLRRDGEGNETTYSYDSAGNQLTETDVLGNTTTNTYDATNNKTKETYTRTHNGTTRTENRRFSYSGQNRLTSTTNAEAQSTTHQYNNLGQQIKTSDPKGRETTMEYDVYGRLSKTTYPDGTEETKAYDAEGNLTEETDRAGNNTGYTYDALNRLTKTTYADGTNTRTSYDAVGQVSSETDQRGNTTTYTYDNAGRRISSSDVLGNTTTFAYDANGNLIEQTDAKGNKTRYSYNSLDQRIKTTFADDTTLETDYDALGRQITTTDQNGNTTDYSYDALGRLTKATDALNQETSYSYDEVGNKLTQTDAEGRTTSWTYDPMGRELSRTLPLGQSETSSYDTVGNRKQQSDFKQNLQSFSYDSDNDWLTESKWFFENPISYTYNTLGQRLSAVDDSGTYHYTYDTRQRLTQETKPDGTTLDYSYDDAGNKTRLISTVNGLVTETSYTYDALNRLETVTDANGITTYSYDDSGNRQGIDYSNGSSTEYSYDNLNRLTQILHKDPLANTLASFDYTLDATGRRTQIVEHSGRTSDYVYDDLYRLTGENIIDPINGNYAATYEYDKVGNRIYSTIDAVQSAYTYDDNDRLLQQGGTTYTYDDNGNTLSEALDADLTQYTWDSDNRLIGSTKTTPSSTLTSTFVYDIDDNRIAKTVDDNGNLSSTDFIVDNNQDYAQVLHEVDSATLSTEVTYTFGDDLLSQDRAGQLQVYHYDGLGSTRLLTDSTGIQTDTYDYEAFGDTLNQVGFTENSYLYTGEQYDEGIEQYYLRNRYYNQDIGRFNSMDDWMGNAGDPATLHKYSYANVDPVNNIDPSGRFSLGSLAAALDIRSVLSNVQIEIGMSLLDAAFDDGDAQNNYLIGIASMGGPAAFKLLQRLSSKFRKACGVNSFDGDTLVSTELGLRPISVIKIGDKVWAYNEETGEKSLQAVVHLIQGEGQKDLVTITLDSGEEITATAEHPFYLPREKQWLDADELNTNDVLLSLADTSTLISDVEAYSRMARVYNLTVANDHTYYVGDAGVLSHNASKCSFPNRKLNYRTHIVRGEISPGGTIKGFHSRFAGVDTGNIKLLEITNRGKRGTYKGIVGYTDKNGRLHTKLSSFFPDNWSPAKIMREVDSAIVRKISQVGKLSNGKHTARTSSGLKIIFAVENGKLASAWPKL